MLHMQGRAYFELSKYKEAKRCFEEMRRVDPTYLDGLCMYVLKYYSRSTAVLCWSYVLRPPAMVMFRRH